MNLKNGFEKFENSFANVIQSMYQRISCSKTVLVNSTRTLSIRHLPNGRNRSANPMWPPALVMTRIRLGFFSASSTGIAAGRQKRLCLIYSKGQPLFNGHSYSGTSPLSSYIERDNIVSRSSYFRTSSLQWILWLLPECPYS